ncbi:MAG: hypothetical protein ACYC2T_00400 [Bacillota bacterium]
MKKRIRGGRWDYGQRGNDQDGYFGTYWGETGNRAGEESEVSF